MGGPFSLSGLLSNGLTGGNMALASLIYRYRVSKEDFFANLSMPLYVGMSAEVGEAWYGNENFNNDKLLYAGSLYLVADTLLGPFCIDLSSTQFDYYPKSRNRDSSIPEIE